MVLVIFAPVKNIITNHADMLENIDIFADNVFMHKIGLHSFILDAVKHFFFPVEVLDRLGWVPVHFNLYFMIIYIYIYI